MSDIKKLNLGAGEYKKEGYINVDWVKEASPDILHDLREFPYPFHDNEFDLIEADHVLEHLNDPFQFMKEAHRILKNNGRILIRVPHFSRGFTHPEHKRGFDVTLPLYFQKSFKGGYQGVEFEIGEMKLSWFAQKYIKKQSMSPAMYYTGLTLGWLFSSLANLSPIFCSRLWCYWVGGFEEISYEFICKK